MTYSTGGLIQATDYNGFVSTTASANINATWGTASAGAGYGQGNVATINVADTVTATQWATLNNTITSAANHQGTSITARTNPVAGNTIAVLSSLNTDITNCYTNRNNAASVGSQYTGWTGTTAKTTNTGSAAAAWTITFTHTVTFANTAAYYNFFNAGGTIKWYISKNSTGTVADTEWNSFVGFGGAGGVCSGNIVLTGAGTTKTINGVTYLGTNKFGGSGTPATYASGTGLFNLSTANTTLYQQNDPGGAYTSNYVRLNALVDSTSAPTTLTFYTTWYDNGDGNPGSTAQISGGSATSGISFGSAPATVITLTPPEQTNIANTWGSQTIVASVA